MTNQSPSTPVKVPSSAASYTPATLDPDLRSQINAILWRDGHVAKIQDHLLHALHANSANWPTAIQSHALGLLRSGEVTTFPALLRRVIDDVRHDAAAASGASSPPNSTIIAATAASSTTNPAKATNGADVNGSKVNGETGGTDTPDTQQEQSQGAGPSLAVPAAVIEEALKVTRASLEMVVEIAEDGGT